MQLVERHIINKNSEFYSECENLCFLSKNLYNKANYIVRQEFIDSTKKKNEGLLEHANYLNYYEINKLMINTNDCDYTSLPRKVSNQTLMLLDKNWKSFFKSIKDYSKNKNKYKGRPKLPSYKDKLKGRFPVVYDLGSISKKYLKVNIISLSKTSIKIPFINSKQKLNCVRIVPRLDHYVIEIIYTISDKPKLINNGSYLGIDLGVGNLATLTSNVKEFSPIIINGKPLKSINQYYNKNLAYYKSKLELTNKKKSSNKLRKLTNKRNEKVNNYLHKASKVIVNLAKTNSLNTIVIGKNDNWKQNSKMSATSNQNFASIPHSRFIQMISYKCEIEGINVILQEESYTSKASFLNLDNIPTYNERNGCDHEFSGYRCCRGLYKIKGKNICINADVNGSYNILRKAVPNVFADGIEGLAVNPIINSVAIC